MPADGGLHHNGGPPKMAWLVVSRRKQRDHLRDRVPNLADRLYSSESLLSRNLCIQRREVARSRTRAAEDIGVGNPV